MTPEAASRSQLLAQTWVDPAYSLDRISKMEEMVKLNHKDECRMIQVWSFICTYWTTVLRFIRELTSSFKCILFVNNLAGQWIMFVYLWWLYPHLAIVPSSFFVPYHCWQQPITNIAPSLHTDTVEGRVLTQVKTSTVQNQSIGKDTTSSWLSQYNPLTVSMT